VEARSQRVTRVSVRGLPVRLGFDQPLLLS
jgi:hypothetical protein